MKKPVIYKIRNVVNQKFYVGSTTNMKERARTHRNRLRRGKHHSAHLQAAWNKYGEECFVFEVVEEVPTVELLRPVEDRWLADFVGKECCYNKSLYSDTPMRGIRTEDHPCFGRIVTEESRAAISASLKAFYAAGPENHPRMGKTHTEEAKAKISAKIQVAIAEGRGGKFIPSAETRLRMSLALKGNQNTKGYIRTEEHRRKLAEANKGNKHWLGKHHTAEAKAKLSKRVLEVTTNTEFSSLTAVLGHYGFNMPTLRRALRTGKPITRGALRGLQFRYIKP